MLTEHDQQICNYMQENYDGKCAYNSTKTCDGLCNNCPYNLPNQDTTMHQFLVQKCFEGKMYTTIYTETELINYLDMEDCSDEEYKIFDISTFGEVKEVFYHGWKPNRLIEIADGNGNIIVCGCGTDH